jgi:molybdopterin-guanine dinucleotide biosynthesis protein A
MFPYRVRWRYDQSMASLTGFVLAGGKSSRMGRDKALLELGGQTLLARALGLLGTAVAEVRIVGDHAKFSSFGVVVEDILADHGPLGGIHAALKASRSELNLILAVDLPLVKPAFLEHLVVQAQTTEALVTVPRCGGHFQPLCAVYRQDFCDVAERSLAQGKNKIDPLFATVPTRILEEEELTLRGFGPEIFHNLNTPQDLERAQKWFARAGDSR